TTSIYTLSLHDALPISVLSFGYAYFNLDFMQKKVDSQIEKAEELSEDEISNTRFGALKMDWQYIKSQPLIGNGLHVKTRFRFHRSEEHTSELQSRENLV